MDILPRMVLQDLKLMEDFLEPQNAVVYEADLIGRYGQDAVWRAIDDHVLEHRRLPFRDGRERCICWLGPKGREQLEDEWR